MVLAVLLPPRTSLSGIKWVTLATWKATQPNSISSTHSLLPQIF